jgi:hypothetical protein
MRVQVPGSGLVVNVLNVGETVRAAQEIKVNKNARTHAETATNMIVLVETAGTVTRNAQMSNCIGVDILWSSRNPLLCNVFDSYLYL